MRLRLAGDLIHNPEFTTGLWDGMEDGASINNNLSDKWKTVFNARIEILLKDPVFKLIYESLQKDFDNYNISEMTAADKEDERLKDALGFFDDGLGGCIIWKNNFDIKLMPENDAFTEAVFYEEFFHAAQSEYYILPNPMRDELEAKVAAVFYGYRVSSSAAKLSPSLLKENLVKLGFPDYEVKMIVNNEQIDSTIVEFFDSVISKKNISDELKKNFNDKLQKYTLDILHPIYKFTMWYKGDLEFFNSLIK